MSTDASSLLKKQSFNQPQSFIDWESVFGDSQIDIFIENGFIVFDDVFSQSFLTQLQKESGYIRYQDAKLEAGGRIENIRGDKTHWIDSDDAIGLCYLTSIEALANRCNQIFYTGIQYCEAHYACYPVGFGYQWHSDNPKGRNERILSAVFYLNNEWNESLDGGCLEILDKNNQSHLVSPKANRLILFDSNLQHQVQIAHRERFSIATWLRRT